MEERMISKLSWSRTIKQQLHFTTSSLQWVVTAYALTFGGFLLLGGRAADLFGRRRTLLAGMGAFTAFSLLIALSHTPTQLIVLRALQGLSAAFMSPSALSIVLVSFRDGAGRNKALSFWTLVSTGGAAFGLLLVGVIMSILIARIVPAHAAEEKQKGLDVPGAALATSSLMLQVYAFSQAPTWGWLSTKTLLSIGVALGLMLAFLINEARAQRPLMPLSIFRIRNVVGANAIMALLYGTMLSSFFLLTLYTQTVLHFSPVVTGLSFLPFPITIALIARQMPKLVGRYGFKRFLVFGPLVIMLGLFWLAHLQATSSYWVGILPAAIVIPLGIGMTMMPTIAAATSGVPAREAGLASGLVNTSQQMGGALGLSILSGVAASVTAGSLDLGVKSAAVHGYDVAFLVDVGFMALVSLIAFTVIRGNQKPAESQQTDSEPAPMQMRPRRRATL
jgi:MFS family permease